MMDRRRELTAHLVEALGGLAMGCDEGEVRTLSWDERTTVSAYDVRAAAQCQAALAATPEPFVDSPALVTRFLGLSAGRRLHQVDGSLIEAVRRAMIEIMDSERWPGPYLRSQPRDVKALCASKAITWLGRTLEVLELSELRRWQYGRDLTWDFPGRGLRLRAKLDLMSPDALPVIVTTSTSPQTMTQVAFVVLLVLINDLRPIDEAQIVVLNSGERISVDPETMVERGIDGARVALEAILEQSITGADATDPPPHLRTDGSLFGCRVCPFTACADRFSRTRGDGELVTLGGLRLPGRRKSVGPDEIRSGASAG